MASSTHKWLTWPGSPASRRAPSISTSGARTISWCRSSSARCGRPSPKAGRHSKGLHPEASLRRIARLHLERLGAERELAIVFQVELRGTTKFMERFSATYVREYLGIIRDVIAEGQARRVFRAGINPTLVAKALFGALDEMATNWVLSPRTYELAADADPIVDLILHGVRTSRKL
jgi:hypothetical protein